MLLLRMMMFSRSMSSLSLAISAGLLIGSEAPISSSLQNILKNTHGSPAYEYPTDLTKGIMPVSFVLVIVTAVKGRDARSLGFKDKADTYPANFYRVDTRTLT